MLDITSLYQFQAQLNATFEFLGELHVLSNEQSDVNDDISEENNDNQLTHLLRCRIWRAVHGIDTALFAKTLHVHRVTVEDQLLALNEIELQVADALTTTD